MVPNMCQNTSVLMQHLNFNGGRPLQDVNNWSISMYRPLHSRIRVWVADTLSEESRLENTATLHHYYVDGYHPATNTRAYIFVRLAHYFCHLFLRASHHANWTLHVSVMSLQTVTQLKLEFSSLTSHTAWHCLLNKQLMQAQLRLWVYTLVNKLTVNDKREINPWFDFSQQRDCLSIWTLSCSHWAAWKDYFPCPPLEVTMAQNQVSLWSSPIRQRSSI